MKKITFLLLGVLLLSAMVGAFYQPSERPDLWNGYDWQQMTEEQKFYFTSGIIAASNNFAELMAFLAEEEAEFGEVETVREIIDFANEYYEGNNLDTLIISDEITGKF